MERRSLLNDLAGVKLKETERGKIADGYAAVYYDGTPSTEFRFKDWWNGGDIIERILPGAFDKVLGGDVLARFEHEVFLGRSVSGTLRLFTDCKGLRYEIDIPDTQAGRDLVTHLERRDIRGSSFCFSLSKRGVLYDVLDEKTTVRTIKEFAELYDVGPVVNPAYTGTTAGLRSDRGDATDRFLREHRAEEARRRLDLLVLDLETA